jgi:hypothetical protein
MRMPVHSSNLVVIDARKAEQDERLVPGHAIVVERCSTEIRLPIRTHTEVDAEYVVTDSEVAVAQLFGTGEERCERAVVGTDEMFRQVGTQLHDVVLRRAI